ncbi:conserved membrane hypothetical protein [uncultured Gammaproteobacteria bacterium]
MAKFLRVLMLCLAVIVITVARPAMAQLPPHPSAPAAAPAPAGDPTEELRRTKNELALFYYGSRYSMNVVAGVVVGGVIGNVFFGGLGSTLIGSTAGALTGVWWFLDQYAATFLSRHAWD